MSIFKFKIYGRTLNLYPIESKALSPKMKNINRDTNLQIIFWLTLVSVLGGKSIHPPYPRIVNDLQITEQSVQSITLVFAFPGLFLTPILGIFLDRIESKKILVPPRYLFCIAGGSCFTEINLPTLMLLRFLQSIESAPQESIYITTKSNIFDKKNLQLPC